MKFSHMVTAGVIKLVYHLFIAITLGHKVENSTDLSGFILTNRPDYIHVIQDHEANFQATLMHKVMDYNIFDQARDLADQLKPVAVATDKTQSDTTGLADVCKISIDLQDESLLQPHKYRIQHNFSKANKSSHILHPGFRGCRLSTKYEESAVEWLLVKDPSYVEDIIAFDAKAVPFPAFLFKTSEMAALTW